MCVICTFHGEMLGIQNRNGFGIYKAWGHNLFSVLQYAPLPALSYHADAYWVASWPVSDFNKINRTSCWAKTGLLLCLGSAAEFPLLPE